MINYMELQCMVQLLYNHNNNIRVYPIHFAVRDNKLRSNPLRLVTESSINSISSASDCCEGVGCNVGVPGRIMGGDEFETGECSV